MHVGDQLQVNDKPEHIRGPRGVGRERSVRPAPVTSRIRSAIRGGIGVTPTGNDRTEKASGEE